MLELAVAITVVNNHQHLHCILQRKCAGTCITSLNETNEGFPVSSFSSRIRHWNLFSFSLPNSGAWLWDSRSLVISRVSKDGWVGNEKKNYVIKAHDSKIENDFGISVNHEPSWAERCLKSEVGQTQPSNAEAAWTPYCSGHWDLEKLLGLQTNLRNSFLEE